MMKAVGLSAFGDVTVLTEVSVPRPTVFPTGVVVQVKATSVNPVDFKIRKGNLGPRAFPAILGFDVSGIITEVGSEVKGFAVGDEVLAGPSVFGQGADAEFIATDYRRMVCLVISRYRTRTHSDFATC
jgi:NADPH:quinone reductase-like Zn-dependent oxidoreductase